MAEMVSSLSESDKDKIRTWAETGAISDREMAEQLGVNVALVERELQRLAIGRTPKKRVRAAPRPPKVLGVAINRSAMSPDDVRPGSTMHECLVGDCDWVLILWPAKPDSGDVFRLAAAVGIESAVEAMAKEQAAWVDKELRFHLEQHDVIEWAETVRDLESANAAWEERCQALVAQSSRDDHAIRTLQERLQASQDKVHELEAAVAPRNRVRTKDPLAGAAPIPAGIPVPVMDPMKEPIVPTDQRAQGQVARKG